MKTRNQIIKIIKELNKKRLILSKNIDSNSNIQEMILHGQVCILQDILQDWTLI